MLREDKKKSLNKVLLHSTCSLKHIQTTLSSLYSQKAASCSNNKTFICCTVGKLLSNSCPQMPGWNSTSPLLYTFVVTLVTTASVTPFHFAPLHLKMLPNYPEQHIQSYVMSEKSYWQQRTVWPFDALQAVVWLRGRFWRRENRLANASGIWTCHGTIDSNALSLFRCDAGVCVCVRDVGACRLSAPDRFIVEGQRCLVLSLKQPVFSPEGSN